MVDIIDSKWTELDASNTGAAPDGVQGGYAPSTVAPILRSTRGALKRFYVQSNAIYTSGGSANAYTLTYAGAPAKYDKGIQYAFFANHSNTGAATLNINALGAKPIIGNNGSTLALGQITAGTVVIVYYDGTSFRLQNITTNPSFNGSISLSDTSPSLILAETDTTTQGRMVLSGGDLYIQAGAPGAGASGSGDLIFSGYNSTDLAVFKVQANGGLQTIWHSGNTGAGKGDDSDLLDGQHGSFYQNASNLIAGTIADARLPTSMGSKTFTNTVTIANPSTNSQIEMGRTDAATSSVIDFHSSGNAIDYDSRILATGGSASNGTGNIDIYSSVLRWNNNSVYTAANTGSGKGDDSDLLDGQHGTYYRDLANSTGTLPNARISGAYDGITTLGQTGLHTVTTTGEAIRIASPDTTSDPHLSFYKTTTRQGYFQHSDGTASSAGFALQNDIATGGATRLTLRNTGGADGLGFNYGATTATVWHSGNLVAADINGLYGYTPPNGANTITAGNGLSGGGSIAASRTITLGTPGTITNATTNSVSTTSHTHEISLTAADINGFLGYTATNAARQVIAGNGLTGGGNFTADRTVTLGTPGDITNSTTNSVSATSHTHALGFTAAEVSTTTSDATTSFPLGHLIMCYTTGLVPSRNVAITPTLYTADTYAYVHSTYVSGVGATLGGTWRARGRILIDSNHVCLLQRTA
ncbi:hypothetical protein QM996_02600 [Sinorhizobium chiapasense]